MSLLKKIHLYETDFYFYLRPFFVYNKVNNISKLRRNIKNFMGKYFYMTFSLFSFVCCMFMFDQWTRFFLSIYLHCPANFFCESENLLRIVLLHHQNMSNLYYCALSYFMWNSNSHTRYSNSLQRKMRISRNMILLLLLHEFNLLTLFQASFSTTKRICFIDLLF